MKWTVISILWVFIFLVTNARALGPTTPGCASSELDIIYVIDSSADVSEEDLEKSKAFVRRLTEPFDVSPVATRVSYIMYGETPRVVAGLDDIVVASNDYEETFGKLEANQVLENAISVGGSRRTGKALKLACDEALKSNSDGSSRRAVPAIIIVLAAGYSEDDIPSDLSCKSGDQDTDVTIIGVATKPRGTAIFGSKHVDISIDGDGGLDKIENDVFSIICKERAWSRSLAEQDLVFLLDRSVVIPRDGLEYIKQWMLNVVKRFELGSDFTRVGIVEFGGTPLEIVDVNANLNADELQRSIANITYYRSSKGEQNLEEALRQVALISFRDDEGDQRLNLHRNLIIITTASSEVSGDARTAANDLKLGGVDIYVASIGVENARQRYQYLSSKPQGTHMVESSEFTDFQKSWKAMLQYLRQYVFKRYSGAMLDLYFIVGGITDETNRVKTTDLIKRVIDLYYIGPNQTQVWIKVGSQPITNAGLRKSDIFEEVNDLYFDFDVNISSSVKEVMDHNAGARSKVIITITPEILRSKTFWKFADSRRKNGLFTYGFGVSGGGLKWKYGSSIFGTWNGLTKDYRPAADVIVDDISHEAVEGCSISELDLQFLIDGSSSIKPDDFDLVKDWIQSLVSKFEISPYTTQVGIDQYSGSPKTEFHLNDLDSKPSVMQSSAEIKQSQGITRTGLAINFTLVNSLVPESGVRDEVPKILMVLTDGKSGDVVSQAAKKAHENPSLTTYAVGVADADHDELYEIASEPKDQHVFEVQNFDEMSGLKDVIGRRMCKTVTEDLTDCGIGELDLIVLYEDSNLVVSSKFYPSLVSYILRLAETTTAHYNSRFGVVRFSAKPILVQDFTRNLTQLGNALRTETTEGDGYRSYINLQPALEYVEAMFTKTPGRDHVQKILVTIVSNPISDATFQNSDGLLENNVNIFGVSLGRSSSLTYLEQLASRPEYFYALANSHQLNTIEPAQIRHIRTLTKSPSQVCGRNLSMAFLIDETDNMNEMKFKKILQFVSGISQNFALGDDQSQLSIMQLQRNGKAYKIQKFSGPETCQEVQLIRMNDTLLDAGNAIGVVGSVAFEDVPPNYPKFTIAITKPERTDVMNGLPVADSGAKLITIVVGDGIQQDGEVQTDIISIPSYDDLSSFTQDLMKALCEESTCPSWLFGTKVLQGYDLISSLGLQDSTEVTIKTSEGKAAIYRFSGKSRVTGSISDIFPDGFPTGNIKLTSTLKMKDKATTNSWNLFEIIDNEGTTELSVTFYGKRNAIVIYRSGNSDKREVTFESELFQPLFEEAWGTLEIIFSDHEVRLRIDCQEVGTQALETSLRSLPTNGMVRIGKFSKGRKTATFQLERLDVSCDIDEFGDEDLEECFEIKDITPTRTTAKPADLCDCKQGPPGLPGPAGEKGATGEPGSNGADGRNGLPGLRGQKGEQGEGEDAESIPGPRGLTGPPGPPGPAGPRGPPGFPGTGSGVSPQQYVRNQKAFSMVASDARITQIAQDECRNMITVEVPRIVSSILDRELSRSRYRGLKGDKGSQGEPGRAGDRGYSGPSGVRGKTGVPGSPGEQGAQGPRGPKGNTGERGEKGYGIPGVNGIRGPPGHPGASIRGEPGNKGSRGDPGVQGPPGRMGSRGPNGINGRCELNTCYNAALGLVSQSMRMRDGEQ